MISISENANKNYLAKIVKLKNINPHPNADRLQIAIIDFQSVITGLDAKENDLYVYFPVESQINSDFLSQTNSYRDKELNQEKDKTGFFEKNGRVRAVKLRGEKSMGYVVPLSHIEKFAGVNLRNSDHINQEFDTIKDILLVKKYVVPVKSNPQVKKGKKPRISRLVDGQVHLHIDTENFRRNAYQVKPNDMISITYKVHGTSFWVSNVLVKRKLNLIEKFFKLIGLKIQETENDFVYGSRRVVKNEFETKKKEDFYGYDLWGEIKEDLKEFIPKGYTLYGECVGYTKDGKWIQKNYDYGCNPGERKIYIYRITFTNEDGIVNNLSTLEVKQFCEHYNLNYVPLLYYGKAKDLFPETEHYWTENFVKFLEENYTEKDCYICKNQLPEEGIVIRKENLFQFEAYKLKSFKFLELETKLLDSGEVDIEEVQSESQVS